MKKLIAFSLVALLLSAPVSTFAQSASPSAKDFANALDSFARKTAETFPDIPGMAIVVIKDDKPIFIRAYGMADKENGIKADADTLWYIASSTKAFTALAAAMLDKEGKIKFSDPVTKYTAGVKFKNPIPEKITVRDLLTHTSGLRNGILVNRLAFTGQVEPADLNRVFAEATSFSDDFYGKYAYTNLGYNIYGLLLQNTLNTKWQDLLQTRVFDPARGAVIRSVVDKTDENMQSAGGVFMSIGDLGKWINLNMNGGKLGGKQVFPAELIRNAQTGYTKSTRNEPPFSGDGEYGLGWQIGKYRNEKVIYHHGGFAGYRSHVSFMPDKRIGIGVLVNNDIVGGRAADMVAAYGYDRWLDTENLEADYAKQLQDFAAQYEMRKKQVHASALERAKRTWQLSKPLAAYVGTYRNDLYGTIQISTMGDAPAVRMGNLNAIATPFTDKESIRVEMVPGGNGEVIRFNLNGDSVASLNYAGADFRRLP